MAAGKENTGLQIALIIFVMLTIVLSVTTFIYFKENEESLVAKKSADEKLKKEEKVRKEREADVNTLKQLVGKGSADPVDEIMNGFKRDQETFAATYEQEAGQVYPAIIKYQSDQFRKLQDQILDYQKQIATLKGAFDQDLASARKATTDVQTDFKAQAAEIRTIRDGFTVARKQFTTGLDKASDAVRKTQQDVLKQREEFERQQVALAEQVKAKQDQLEMTKKELLPYKEVDFEAPDGKIVGISQAKGTVWINLGSADGLKRMTTFSVYPFDVNNAQDATPKGAIEVIRIRGANLAEARITDDLARDPIVPDDKIFSSVFRPGRPESFAIAGLIDIDGDERSDLEQLKSLIRQNSGVVDVSVDEKGRRDGTTMTAGTKFLVIGDAPTETSDPQVINSYRRMLDEAAKYGVKTMNLSDFLTYMGYKGRERSVGLGQGADPDDFRARPDRGVQSTTISPFQRRRTSGRGAYNR